MKKYTPKHNRYREAVRELHSSAPFCAQVGIELIDIEPGAVMARAPLKPGLTQQHGYAHAGMIATLADTVCGLAAYSLMADGQSVLSSSINLSLMRPAGGEVLRACGRVIKAGNRVYYTEADIYSGNGETEQLVARAAATMMAR